jgi:hypothetical protein
VTGVTQISWPVARSNPTPLAYAPRRQPYLDGPASEQWKERMMSTTGEALRVLAGNTTNPKIRWPHPLVALVILAAVALLLSLVASE